MSDTNTPCYVCGLKFDDALAKGISDGWTFHWDSAYGATVIAETCGDVCASKFEAIRNEVDR